MANRVQLGAECEKNRILPLQQVSELTNLSKDTLKRRHSAFILKLSPRRLGMRYGDVLKIGQPTA